MFESLIVTLREGIEAALVVGILLTYLRQSKKQFLNKAVYWGAGLAILASILGAIIFQVYHLDEERYEGILYLVAAIFVGSMMFWMARVAKTIKKDIQQKIDALTSSSSIESTWSKAGWGILSFTFWMVFREGIETVLFLSAVSLTTEALLSFLGGIIGLILSVAFCIFFVKGTIRINLSKFFLITEIVLGIFVFQLLLNAYHEFAEQGILPATQYSMTLIGPIVKNNTIFLLAILLIPFLFLFISGKTKKEEPLPQEGPERRKFLAKQKSEKTWKYSAATLWLIIMLAIGGYEVHSATPKQLTPAVMISSENGDIKISLSDLNDGNLHRYGYILDNVTVRFLAIKQADNKVATAFDACQICGDYGFIQEGKNLTCLNCGAQLYMPSLGEPGGCNPIPLKSHIENNFVVIHANDLSTEKSRFSHAPLAMEVIDPVCGMKIKVTSNTPHLELNGKTYYFCSMDKCMKEFQKNPEKYAKK